MLFLKHIQPLDSLGVINGKRDVVAVDPTKNNETVMRWRWWENPPSRRVNQVIIKGVRYGVRWDRESKKAVTHIR